MRKFAYDDHLTKLDRRLLKGFYTNVKSELIIDDDDERGIVMNMDVDNSTKELIHGNRDDLKKAMRLNYKKMEENKASFKPIHALKLGMAGKLGENIHKLNTLSGTPKTVNDDKSQSQYFSNKNQEPSLEEEFDLVLGGSGQTNVPAKDETKDNGDEWQ